ncbi:MAG: hypothetical protein J7623_07155 [Chitinophaga sp.]|uniref:hypothetical protein n=1 Tax=Chitinophaga sp. TaxID=1869181 RepID=UPI001AFEE1F6|nr:hypothetical protein [Chitinophaga sp.]MBO9728401.1 hypothetical protein [Chitinophaga sp.]
MKIIKPFSDYVYLYRKICISFFLITIVANKSMAQVRITEWGVNDIKLGMNILDAPNIIPFSSFKDKSLFVTCPNDSFFYALKLPSYSLSSSVTIPIIIVSTNENKIINNIFLFVDDKEYAIEEILNTQFGLPGVKNYSDINEPRKVDLLMWDANDENTLFLTRTRIPTVDPTLKFIVTLIHIYKTKSVHDFEDYSIEIRTPHHDLML